MLAEQTMDMFQRQEMTSLLSKNLSTSLLIGGAILGVLIAFSFSKKGKLPQRIVLAIFFFLPWTVRFFSSGNAYDTGFALLWKLSDLTAFTCFCFLVGRIFIVISIAVEISGLG